MHGREARTPMNVNFSSPGTTLHPTPTPEDYTASLNKRLSKAFRFVKEHTQRAQVAQQEHYNRKNRTISYSVGDLVWLHDPVNIRHKLEPNWKGPYKILSSSTEGLNYKISKDGVEKMVHHNRLKPFRSRMKTSTSSFSTPTSSFDRSTSSFEKSVSSFNHVNEPAAFLNIWWQPQMPPLPAHQAAEGQLPLPAHQAAEGQLPLPAHQVDEGQQPIPAHQADEGQPEPPPKQSRSGRLLKPPSRFRDYDTT